MRPAPEIAVPPSVDSALVLPSKLIALNQWVAWWSVEGRNLSETLPNGGRTRVLKSQPKPHKLPIDPNTGGLARVNEPRTWAPYQEAVAAVGKYAVTGVGFVFRDDDPFSGIDLDNCRDPRTGILTDWAQDIVRFLDSYTEVSPSRTGVKILIEGKLPRGTRNQRRYQAGKVEIFSRGRYFTCTGARLEGTPTTIEPRQPELLSLHTRLFSEILVQLNSKEDARQPLRDSEIIDRARLAGNGSKFSRLWSGQWKGEYPSQSEGDQALCCILAFWVGGAPQRIDGLFRQSGLYREKWEREDYRERTIRAAIERTAATYRGSGVRASSQLSDGRPQSLSDRPDDSLVATNGATDRQPSGPRRANVNDLAAEIMRSAYFAQDRGGRLYVFQEGVYKPTGEQFVLCRVKEIMQAWEIADKWTSRRSKEVAAFIRVDSPQLLETPNSDVVNLRNGLFDIGKHVLNPHTPDFLSPVQIPVDYDPSARCPAWEKFVEDVFPEDSQGLAWELAAWLMTPDMSIQKAVLLTGEGANGKSTYLRGLIAFLGKQNVAAVSLQQLERDKFATARLVGKLANICSDIPSTHLASTTVFKAVTGGDLLPAEYKFLNSFEFLPYAKLVFSANQPPRCDDATHGFFRRWLVVQFARTFEEQADGTVPRIEMDKRLANPTELSGVLNHALKALPNLRRRGFSTSDSMRQAFSEFHDSSNPLSLWLDQNTIESPAGFVPKAALMDAYNATREKLGKPLISKTAFGLALRRARPSVEDRQRMVKGKVTECYVGLEYLEKQD